MKLTDEEKAYLTSIGYDDSDIKQIAKATSKRYTKYMHKGVYISREDAIRLLGRKTYLSGIARSAFHNSASRNAMDGSSVYFDSFELFKRG